LQINILAPNFYPGNTLDKFKTKSGKDGKLTDSLGSKINLRR